MPADQAAFEGIKVKVIDASGDPVSGAAVKFRGKWSNQQQTRGGGKTGPEGTQGLGGPQPDDRIVEVLVALEGSKGCKKSFAWSNGTIHTIKLEDARAGSDDTAVDRTDQRTGASSERRRILRGRGKDGASKPPLVLNPAGSKLGWQGKFQAYFAMWPHAIREAAQSQFGVAALALLVIGLVAMLYRGQAEWLAGALVLAFLISIIIIVLAVIFGRRN